MRALFYILIFLPIPLAAEAKEADFHICYFSLNNEKEFQEAQRFTAKLNKFSTRKITVSEHLSAGSNPADSFRELVNSGQRCDGLVISGHHTGSFSGVRADGNLQLDFLENLSCNPKAQAWFRKVNALWLQGCRTLGVGQIAPNQQEVDIFSADFHTDRLNNDHERQEHGVRQSLQDINREFTATLDQDNPLSSRFLRVFPHAKVFGWTKTAPGINAHSEYSIPYHMAHLVSLLNKDFPQDPIADQINAKDAANYALAMMITLSELDKKNKYCEDLTIEAWKSHGQVYGPKKFSFDNPDLNAFPKLYSSLDTLLQDVRKNECALHLAESPEGARIAVKNLLKDPRHLPFVSNAIFAKIKKSEQEEKSEIGAAIQEEVISHKELLDYFRKKIQAPQTGLLSKIDYYGYYKQFTGEELPEEKNAILKNAIVQLNKPVAETDYDARDFRQSLMASLLKNSIFELKNLQEIKGPDALAELAWNLNLEFSNIENNQKQKVFDYILADPNINDLAIAHLVRAASDPDRQITLDREKVYPALLDRKNAGAATIDALSQALVSQNQNPAQKLDSEATKRIFEKMIEKLPKETELPSYLIAGIVQEKPEQASLLLEKIFSKKEARKEYDFSALYMLTFFSINDEAIRARIWKHSMENLGFNESSLALMIERFSSFSDPAISSNLLDAILESSQFNKKLAGPLEEAVNKSTQTAGQKQLLLKKIAEKQR